MLEGLVFPDSLITLGERVISGCEKIKTINYPKSLETVYASRAFENSYIENITIPKEVKKIKNNIFMLCTTLKEVIIEDGVEEIGANAFYGCTALTEIEIPASVKKIGDSAFYGCTALKTVALNEGLEYIGYTAFRSCSALESITLPDSVTTMAEGVFDGCTKLKKINYPLNLVNCYESSYVGPFYRSGIEEVVIPDGVTTIIDYIFAGCSTLKTVNIPDSVTDIKEYAFRNCTGIERIKVPATVTTIHTYAFYGCTETLTVLCYSGSAAHQHCVDKGIAFILIDDHECEFELISEKAPTCVNKGNKVYVCTVCEVEKTDVIPANGHSMGDWYVTSEVKCGVNGEERRDCGNCNYYERNALIAPAHTSEIILPAVKATCTSTGLTEGKKCSSCGTVTVKQNVTAKLDHTYTPVTTSATCTANGQTVYTCSCGDSYTEIIPTTGHDYQNGICTKCGDNKTADCSHMCHKSGFMGFIWKIVQFFWKLFKMNPVCECGAAHY